MTLQLFLERGANETMVVHIGGDVDAGGKLAGRLHVDGVQGSVWRHGNMRRHAAGIVRVG